jgi:hypothetical protein
MRRDGTTCEYTNAVPGTGSSATDQQGWGVKAYTVTVVLPPAPAPVFSSGPTFSPSNMQVVLGQSFTVAMGVRNDGGASDDGGTTVSFPDLTQSGDAGQVGFSAGSNDDTPGYLERAAGSAIYNHDCQTMTASCLMVEYADEDWLGGETNLMTLQVTPRTLGSFRVYVRSAMRRDGTTCEYTNAVPGTGSSATDQQGWGVKAYTVTVVPAPPSPSFTQTPVFTPSSLSITVGQSFTLALRVRNDGGNSDDGGITVAFPALAQPGDAARVSFNAGSNDDVPGYIEREVGSTIYNINCQAMGASHLMVEYADENWAAGETNLMTLLVTPRTDGTFRIRVRSAMRETGTSCAYFNGVPSGGTSITDQQGWPAKEYRVTVNSVR